MGCSAGSYRLCPNHADLCHFCKMRSKRFLILTSPFQSLETNKMATPSVPQMHANTIEADTLSVKRTATHIYFSGFEGPDPESCFQQWIPSPSSDYSFEESSRFPTSEHDTMFRKAILCGDQVVARRILTVKTPEEAKLWDDKLRMCILLFPSGCS